jgi:hypothetical protein
MLNFWNKAGQFITSAFVSEKTKDNDYHSLCTKMNNIETGINSLKSVIKEFGTFFQPFCKFIRLLNESIDKIYNDSPLKNQIKEIINRHELILKEIDKLSRVILKLYSKTSEWDTIFEKAKESIRLREEKRKNFDHYEKKLLKVEGDPNKKKLKNFIERNQDKYSTASSEYIQVSEKSFETINNSIKLSWELANPIFGDLIMTEKNLFEMISSHLNDFTAIINDFKDTMHKAFNPEESKSNEFYDPKKYMRSQSLIQKDKNKYTHNFERNTNTFGEIPIAREKLFNNIQDMIYFIDSEQQ